MNESAYPNYLMSIRIGRSTIGENLESAKNAGVVTAADDGTLMLPFDKGASSRAFFNDYRWPFPCRKLLFLFEYAYGRSQVPWGCRSCFKVKVIPKTLTELVAVLDATAQKPYPAKFQPDMNVTYSSDLYGAYFYANGLEKAREIYKDIKSTLDSDQGLKGIQMVIKRGCTDYEVYCGPSNSYTFPEPLGHIENLLLEGIKVKHPERITEKMPRAMLLAQWTHMAFQIGDETYLELTGGRRLFPKTISYDVE